MITAALCATLALTVTGCGLMQSSNSTPTTEPVAKTDASLTGPLTVYTSLPQAQADAYLASYKALYPNVKVTVVSDTPTAIADKLVKEVAAPVADVVWHTPLSSVMTAIEATAIAPYAYSSAQLDPVGADFTDGVDTVPMFVGTDAQLITFAAKTGSGGSAPAAFVDLTDPALKGKIVAPSINTEAGYTMVSNLLVNKDEEYGWTYLDDLNKNVAYYTDDEAAPVAAVVSGQAAVGIGWDSAVVAAQSADKTIKAVFPGEPEFSPWSMDVDSLVQKPAISPAAKKFLDWAISDPAMTAYAKDTPYVAVLADDKAPAGYPENVSGQLMNPNDFSYTADNHARIVAEWMKRYGSKIKK
jgi:iron(III) transport system substrate-binding protein